MIQSAKRKLVRALQCLLPIVTFALCLHAPPVAASPTTIVINGHDSGPGSLRAALATGATEIAIHGSVSTISLEATLVYTGQEPLRILGSGQTVAADGDYTLFEVSEGADLSISNLSFEGVGGFSAASKGRGKGIFVDVPGDRNGVVTLELTNVAVFDVAGHGIHVSDCDLEDNCGSGSGGGGGGSNASIHAILTNVAIVGVGHGKFDADGLRIDDRGAGDIWLEAVGSSFVGIGADGVELDEGDEGDVIAEVHTSSFMLNGGYCVMVEAHPELDESCFDEGELDLDDGFDIDEAGGGSIHAVLTNVWLHSNLDEGLDLDEEGEGDIDLDLNHISAWFNRDEGIKASEADAGDLFAQLRSVTAVANGDDGVQLEAEQAGGITVTVNATVTAANAKKGLNISQEEALEPGTLKVRGGNIGDGIKTANVSEI